MEILSVKEHEWKCIFLHKPTWCDRCYSFIWGLTKHRQDCRECTKCKLICHSNCARVGETCNKQIIPQTYLDENRCIGKALYDFCPQNEQELGLNRWDIVEIHHIFDQWWYGTKLDNVGVSTGKYGFFPGLIIDQLWEWDAKKLERNPVN